LKGKSSADLPLLACRGRQGQRDNDRVAIPIASEGCRMAKKKRKPNRGTPKRRKPSARRAPDLPALPDPRALEAALQPLLHPPRAGAEPDTPQARAQALLYQAFEEPDEPRRIRLAHDSLAICPDCADAYVLLAEHAPSRKEALHLYQQGVAAG